MRAFVITNPGEASVQDVPAPVAAPGEVVVDVMRAGVCGTDVEFFTGEMPYLHDGKASFPVRIGHEWSGVVASVGAGVAGGWMGRRVTGDTMLGCGVCDRCRSGRGHVCTFRTELGVSHGRPGALAEQVAVPASALRPLPDTVDDAMGALVEPGGNALRAFRAANVVKGERLLVIGAGTIGMLVAMFARANGVEAHLMGRSERSLHFARLLGFDRAWSKEQLPDGPWNGVVDASNSDDIPAMAVSLVEPGRHVALIGLSPTPSTIDTRDLAFNDITAVGILSASPGLDGAIDSYATGAVDPRPLVAASVALEDVASILAGQRPVGAADGPKFHVSISAKRPVSSAEEL